MIPVPWSLIPGSENNYQGVARAGLGSVGAPQSFKEFLAIKDGGDETGGLVAEARKRLAGN